MSNKPGTAKVKSHGARNTAPASTNPSTTSGPKTKLDQLTALLTRPKGASIAEMMSATGWQAHSVRGALAGALKRRGLIITSKKVAGIRHYKGRAAK